ncbi:hypothetical protein [Syntrophomonas palmitatica]|uniref:hypothetical protein n=1 Tax=Syntrophomonas palmitatica TaxID=402877 RepID=UPI0006D104BD|nr:hypothetical protein [Syntrophomonas palmitatica]
MNLNELTPRDLEIVEGIFTGIEGALIIDKEGIVRVFTDYYMRESGLKKEEVLGKRVDEVFPHTRMLEVLNTGKPIIADLWELNGKYQIVSRVPILSDGRIIGALGISIFRYKDEARVLPGGLTKCFPN